MHGLLSAYQVTEGVSRVPGPWSNKSSAGGPKSCMQQLQDSPPYRAMALVCLKGIMSFGVVGPKVSKRHLLIITPIGLGIFGLGVLLTTKVHNGSGEGD